VTRNPADESTALALATGYLDIGRSLGDPRFVSYALTTVAPLVAPGRDDPQALIVAATAEQYQHRFDAALQLLDRALRREPANVQALLIRADLLEVRGDLTAARQACAGLLLATDPLVALTCLASVASRSGELDQSFERLKAAYGTREELPVAVDIWILGVLAEMAMRRRDNPAQDQYLRRALQRAPADLKLRAQYADLLLARADYDATLDLLRDNEEQDALLLRLAIAATRRSGAQDSLALRLNAAFEERLQQANGSAHQRERARFLLEVRRDPQTALQAAKENWQHQREPDDVRLLLTAARAAGEPDAALPVRQWMSEHRYEDRTLQ
jgi:lipopolysaccharide biosynthesis regulator YciM